MAYRIKIGDRVVEVDRAFEVLSLLRVTHRTSRRIGHCVTCGSEFSPPCLKGRIPARCSSCRDAHLHSYDVARNARVRTAVEN